MFAVSCFTLCVINGARDLAITNPHDWQRVLPDLQRVVLAGELRGQGVVPLLPRRLPRQWLPKLTIPLTLPSITARLFDCADALHFNQGHTMLALPESSTRILANRLNWVESRYIPAGTLWRVRPDTAQRAAVYRFELVLTRGQQVAYHPDYRRSPQPKVGS